MVLLRTETSIMTRLSDTQCILLSSASQRDDGSLYPLPSTLKPGGGTTKAVEALVTRGLAEERETSSANAARRGDGDMRYGMFITSAGAAAIGLRKATGESSVPAPDLPVPAAKPPSKTTMVIGMLGRGSGATLPELIEATGWLPHTTRAALTGIRKKGHVIERIKRDGTTCYHIVGAA